MLPLRHIGSENLAAFRGLAAHRAQLWRLLLGILVVSALFFLTTIVVLVIWQILVIQLDLGAALLWTGEIYQLHPLNIAIFLGSFGTAWLGLLLVVKGLHKRGFSTLFGPGGFRARHYCWGLALIGLVSIVEFALMWSFDRPVRNVELDRWLAWVLPLICVLIIQTTAEELFFRGYLQQQLAARFRSPLIWWIIPAVFFGILHFNPGELGANAWIVVAITCLMGLVLGDITARTGNISLAMGLHMGNNIFALLVLGLPGSLSSMTLFLVDVDLSDTGAIRQDLLSSLIFLLCCYAVYLVLLWRGVIAFPPAPSYLEPDAGNDDRRP